MSSSERRSEYGWYAVDTTLPFVVCPEITSAPVREAFPGWGPRSPAKARIRGTHSLRKVSSAAIPTGWSGGHPAAGAGVASVGVLAVPVADVVVVVPGTVDVVVPETVDVVVVDELVDV